MDISAESILSAYMEKTVVISNAIQAEDIEIVLNQLEEREDLIKLWNTNKNSFSVETFKNQLEAIKKLDDQNQVALDQLWDKIEKQQAETKRRSQQVEHGKTAVNKYNAPYGTIGGNGFDQKR